MSRNTSIPVCSCPLPDPAEGLPVTLCCECGRLIMPKDAPIRVETRVRQPAPTREEM